MLQQRAVIAIGVYVDVIPWCKMRRTRLGDFLEEAGGMYTRLGDFLEEAGGTLSRLGEVRLPGRHASSHPAAPPPSPS